jgi:hypothetical protein
VYTTSTTSTRTLWRSGIRVCAEWAASYDLKARLAELLRYARAVAV